MKKIFMVQVFLKDKGVEHRMIEGARNKKEAVAFCLRKYNFPISWVFCTRLSSKLQRLVLAHNSHFKGDSKDE